MSADDIRQLADDILARPEFRQPEPSLLERARSWVEDLIGNILEAAFSGSAGSLVGWVVLIAAVGLIIWSATRFSRTVQVGGRVGIEVEGVHRRSPAAWRAEAEALEAAGEWKPALRCRYRALIGDLVAEGVLEDVAGRTTGEFRRDVSSQAPDRAEAFAAATELFELAWYADRPTGPDENARFRALTVTVAGVEGVNPSLRFALVLIGVLVLVVLVAGNPDSEDTAPPLSPEGTGPSGAKAMTILLDELGAEVTIETGGPSEDADTALLLEDRLDDEQRLALAAWVRRGGTLVVADPESALTPPVVEPLGAFAGIGDAELDADDCDMADLADVEHLELGAGVRYETPSEGGHCFDDGTGAFVVESPLGGGRLVAVGGAYPFLNEGLGRADAAVLVANLLAPAPEGTQVAFLDTTDPLDDLPGEGDKTLIDLVPDRVLLALLQLGLAFGAYVWFRARRAGRPVAEPQPTTLAGSELIAAVGRLLAQERDPERAAGLLRDDLRRTLGRRLGLGPDASLDDLVAAAERGGADPERLRALLAGRPVGDSDALIELARDIDMTRREILHEQS